MTTLRLVATYFICTVVLCANLDATTYYFSSSLGSDDRSFEEAQSPNTPWQSLEKINQVVKTLSPGDSILLKRGDVFFGALDLDRNGRPDAPIYFGAYGDGELPIISGFQKASNWEAYQAGIYVTEVDIPFDQINVLAIDGNSYAMGRWPNADEGDGGYLFYESNFDNAIVDNGLDHNILDWTGAEIVIRKRHWIIDRMPIIDHTGETITFGESIGSSYNVQEDYGYFIQKSVFTLDRFGEWYFDADTRQLYVYFGTVNPNDHEIGVPAVERVIDVDGDYFKLENLDIIGGNEYGVFSDSYQTEYLVMDGCQIRLIGNFGVYLSTRSGFEFRNGIMDWVNNTGFSINYECHNPIIENSTITNIGMFQGMGQNGDGNHVGIFCKNDGLRIERNHLNNIGYSAIDFSGNDVLIKHNFIEHFCSIKSDGGGIYSYNGQKNLEYSDRQVVNNIIAHSGEGSIGTTSNSSKAAIYGVYLDDNTNHVELLDNTIASCGEAGIFLHNTRNIRMTGNTSYNNKIQLFTLNDNKGDDIEDIVAYNNIFFSPHPMQNAAYFSSYRDDIGLIGEFYENNYARPFADDLVIRTQYNVGEEIKKVHQMDLTGFQDKFGLGIGASKSSMTFSFYEILAVNTDNLNETGGFDVSSLPETSCFSVYSDCDEVWSEDHLLDGGAVEVRSTSEANFGTGSVNVYPDKQYLLNFKAYTNGEPFSADLTLRQRGAPWKDVTLPKPVSITNEVQEYEVLLPSPNKASNVEILFYTSGDDYAYFLDDVALYEIDAFLYDPGEFIHIEFNPTLEPKTVNLDKSYIDPYGNPLEGKVVLQPFESKVLIKTTPNEYYLQMVLDDFYGVADSCSLTLNWEAETEFGFEFYTIERSLDGIEFEPIGTVIRNDDRAYQFKDENNGGNYYYRVSTRDAEGDQLFSSAVYASILCLVTPDGPPDDLEPSETSDELDAIILDSKILVDYTDLEDGDIILYDQYGRSLMRMDAPKAPNGSRLEMDVSTLPNGIYFLFHDQSSIGAKKISKTAF